MHIQCNMLFKIFWKVQNYAKTIVKPNGPSQSWVAGHHPYDPTETGQAWTREFSIRNVWWLICAVVALSRCRAVALSRCRVVALSRCRVVAMSRCCVVAMSRCRVVALSRCRDVALSRCRVVALSRCRVVALSRCRDVAMSRCRVVAMSRCRVVAMSRCRVVDNATSRQREMAQISHHRNAHMIRILFVSAWGVKLQGMGSTED